MKPVRTTSHDHVVYIAAKAGGFYLIHHDVDYYYLVNGKEETSKLRDSVINKLLARIAMDDSTENVTAALIEAWES